MSRSSLAARTRNWSGWFLGLGLILLPASAGAQDEKDRAQPPLDVYEWSVWVGNPSQNTLNAPRVYRNAMPGAVGTTRPKVEGADLDRKFAVAPVSVVQVFGDPTADIDVDIRVKQGNILAHWPQANERSGRLQWFKTNFLKEPPAGIAPGNLPDDHWFHSFRKVDTALYLKTENKVDRFLAYDVEVAMPIPVKIRGGPDEYTLQNLTNQKLTDIAVIAPVEGGGFRVGWLDTLPTAVPKETVAEELTKAKAKDEAKKQRDQPAGQAKAAAEVFDAADAEAEKAKDQATAKEDAKNEPKPIPPEGDANIRARVDQALNRSVEVLIENAPRRDVLALVAGQARLRTELDDATLAKEKIDLNAPMTLKAGNIAARDALAEILGSVGLSYRITDDATLFITTATRLAAETKKKTVIEGPPVKLTLGSAAMPTDPTYRAQTRDAYAQRLKDQGMRAEVIQTLLDQYSPPLFEPKGLIVLAHLSRDAIDEAVLLDVFPSPRKLVRTAVVVAHGVDPRLQDQARVLIKQLGDAKARQREAAETQLYDLGPVAVPVLEDALKDKDIEVVFRAERILMRLNRPVP